jgi:cysteine synthase A
MYIYKAKPFCIRLGICTAPEERVPGLRRNSLMAPVEFLWRDAVDVLEEVGKDIFSLLLRLS